MRQFGAGNREVATSVAVNAAGEVYVAGTFAVPLDLDPGPLTHLVNPAGSSDVFVVKLTRDGDFLWGQRIGGVGPEVGPVMRLDPAGNLVIGGTFSSTVDFDTSSAGAFPLTGAGGSDAFLLRLSAAGNFLSAVRWGGFDQDELRELDVDAAGISTRSACSARRRGRLISTPGVFI